MPRNVPEVEGEFCIPDRKEDSRGSMLTPKGKKRVDISTSMDAVPKEISSVKAGGAKDLVSRLETSGVENLVSSMETDGVSILIPRWKETDADIISKWKKTGIGTVKKEGIYIPAGKEKFEKIPVPEGNE